MTTLAGLPASASEPLRVTDSAAMALDYADQQLLAAVREVHQSLARRAFATTRGVSGSLPERAHAVASNSVYAGISTAMRGSAGGLRALARRGVGAPLESSSAGRQVASILHALIGAELTAAGDTSRIRMALRDRAVDVPLEADSLAQTYPGAEGKLVLFLHGLGENDESWGLRDQGGYADQLTAQTDWTPVLLRYNSGLPVADNGAELAALVSELVERWPVPVESIALVGHSMGGLLARSTTVQAFAAGHDWVHHVTHVICLGTPHLGAQLEKAVHFATNALNRVPRSVPFRVPRHGRRPVDLRHAYVSRDEWVGRDITARWGQERIAIAPLAHVTYHFVAPDADDRDQVGSADHASLLQDPRIGDWLVSWLQPPLRRTDER